jgi:hypothetical protein
MEKEASRPRSKVELRPGTTAKVYKCGQGLLENKRFQTRRLER